MARRAIAAALTVGLILRLVFVLRYAHILGDALVYGDIARNVLQHGVYGFSQPLRSTLIRLPGYPLFLALCFRLFGVERYTAVLAVQVVMDLGTCLLLGGIARRLYGERLYGERAGLAAVWLAAVCPFTANYAAAPLTETPTLFCIALAFYALVRWQQHGGRWLYLIAAALSWALLLRPEQGMLSAAVVPAMAWIQLRPVIERRRKGEPALISWHLLRPIVLVSVLTLLPLVPWAARNYLTFHVFQPLAPRFASDPGESTPFGFNRWYRTWAVDYSSTDLIYWNYDGVLLSIGDLPNRAFDSQAQYEATDRLIDDYNLVQSANPALDARWNALAEERIHAAPLRYYLALPVGRVLNMAFRPRTENLEIPLDWWRFKGHMRTALFAWAYGALNLAYFLLAAIGLWRRQRDVIVWSMLATIAMRVALLLTIDNSEMRYTLEFFPVLIVLGAGAIASTPAFVNVRRHSQRSQGLARS